MGSHDRRPQHGPLDGRRERAVGVDPPVEQRPPEQPGSHHVIDDERARWNSGCCRRRCSRGSASPLRRRPARRRTTSRRQSSSRAILAAARAAPRDAGTLEAVNRIGRQKSLQEADDVGGPAMNPPQLASDLEKVPMTRSARTPVAAEVPAPCGPTTPRAWASSTSRRASYSSHRALSRPTAPSRPPSSKCRPRPRAPRRRPVAPARSAGRAAGCSGDCGKRHEGRHRPGAPRPRGRRGRPSHKRRRRPPGPGSR